MTSKFDRKEFGLGGTEEFVREGGSEAMGCGDCSSLSVPEAFRVQYQMNESMIETASNIVLVLDPNGCITRFNPFFESLVGWTLDEVRGRPWWDVLQSGFDGDALRKQFESTFDDTRTRGFLTTIQTRDGGTREVEWYNNPLTRENSELVGFLCVGVDVTERRSSTAWRSKFALP